MNWPSHDLRSADRLVPPPDEREAQGLLLINRRVSRICLSLGLDFLTLIFLTIYVVPRLTGVSSPQSRIEMVGHLHLQAMDDSLKGKNREGLLDSPDSGLPPSPSPPFYSLSPAMIESRAGGSSTPIEHHGYNYRKESKEGKLLPYLLLNSTGTEMKSRMYPVIFGESIEVSPKPEREIRCNSEVKYDSDKHYRDNVYCAPIPTVTSYSETVIAAPNCTWRNYKSELHFEPRQKPLRFQSTTIIFPKHAKNIYRTTLNYNSASAKRWFVSSVQLESSEDASPCIIYTEDL